MISAIPSQPSFRDYILQRRKTDSPAGDFVDDARTDRRFPHARSWDEVCAHLRNLNACDEAYGAGKQVWRGYIRWLDRKAMGSLSDG